jgi:hypothetical protein
MAPSSRPSVRTVQPPHRSRSGEDGLNEAFHELLREAAAQREERLRVHAIQDDEAAKRQSHDLLALARRYATGAGDRNERR